MRDLTKEFENRKINFDNLIQYGFIKNNDIYIFEKNIMDNQFIIHIEISSLVQTSKIIDVAFNEEYVLVDVNKTHGSFVSQLKEIYEDTLQDIIKNCSTLDSFKSYQAKEIINYVKYKYNDELEYLWEKFSNSAVIRNKNNKKWYLVMLIIPKNKLGFNSEKLVEIIDLRYNKDEIEKAVDNNKIFKGYHMNKKSWITIILDESIDLKDIFNLIDNSYNLSIKK